MDSIELTGEYHEDVNNLCLEISRLHRKSDRTEKILKYCIGKIYVTGQLSYIMKMLRNRDMDKY